MRGEPALDAGAHRIEESGEIDDLGLAGGGLDDGDAPGERRGGHDIGGAQDGRAERPAEEDGVAGEASSRGAGDDVSRFEGDLGAQGLQAPEVQIDRAIPDGAPAGHGDPGLTPLREHRPEGADAGPHRAHDVVAGVARGGVGDAQAEDAVRGAADLHAQFAQQAFHVADVGQVGHAAEGDRVVGQQNPGHEGQGGVLGPVDADLPFEPTPALDHKAVHPRASARVVAPEVRSARRLDEDHSRGRI